MQFGPKSEGERVRMRFAMVQLLNYPKFGMEHLMDLRVTLPMVEMHGNPQMDLIC